MYNLVYTKSKVDKVKEGGFQGKAMTFCEFSDLKLKIIASAV
jgi:hypothetical protein